MLWHQLPQPLPPFADFLSPLDDVFGWLAGTLRSVETPRASLGTLDPEWEAPKAITSCRRGVPLELLRYAGVDRLKVDIDYRAENGRWGSRRVRPHSLRYTQVPVVLVVGIATAVSKHLSYGSIYTTKLLRRGIDIERPLPTNVLHTLTVADVMHPSGWVPRPWSLGRLRTGRLASRTTAGPSC